MEPDIDKILSNKIREAELRPVTWKKEAIWQKVQSEVGVRRRYHVLYYAAAAIVPLLVYFALGQISTETKTQVSDIEMAPRQEAAASQNLVVPEEIKDRTPDPAPARPADASRQSLTKIMSSTPEEDTQLAQPEVQNTNAITAPLRAEIKLPEEASVLPEKVDEREQRIRPVVGVIPDSHSGNNPSARRKKRLRKLEPSDAMPWEDPANALVFTVRK